MPDLRRADILQRVMATISSGLELDPLLSNILESAVSLIEATHGTIGLVVERNGKQAVRTVAVHNMPDEEFGAEMQPGTGLAGKKTCLQNRPSGWTDMEIGITHLAKSGRAFVDWGADFMG